MGDAITTARIFRALARKLRDVGVRTVGEAMRASSALTDVLDQQHRAGWVEVATRPVAESMPDKVDSHAYRNRAGDLAARPPRFIAADASVSDALGRMMGEQISSLFISRDGQPALASDSAIVTERDILRAFAANGAYAGRRKSTR